MSEETQAVKPKPEAASVKKPQSTFSRVTRYAAVRLVTLFLTVVVGVFLTIIIANMGGYVDDIRRGEIQESFQQAAILNPAIKALPPEERQAWIEQQVELAYKRYGLDKPFIVRTFAFMTDALTLNLGRSQNMSSDTGSRQVRLIILERIPPTLILFGTVGFILFFVELFFALFLSRRYGSVLDKIIVTLAPMSAAPGWFYGIFLILIFAALLKILPFGGMVDAPPPPRWSPEYFLSLLKHMILPAMAIAANQVIISTYSWRTFFMIYSSEDYVEMAKAKGLTSRAIERRYVLRPTLPTIVTSFAFVLIGIWTGAPIFETVFNWPGLGRQIFMAVGLFDIPVIVGETVIFAYLLAITLFLLDFIYALVDPRVKVGGQGGAQS
jgi:peptide/nickel transport system permease protein